MYKNKNRYFWLLLALLVIIPAVNIYADGSKDLYPNGASGRRAYLTSYYSSYSGSLPFQSYGTHYVYAKAGETIALASSAWTGDATIKLFRPNGSEITTLDRTNNAGRISTRPEELAGPKLTSTDNTTNRYLPIYYTVPAGHDGIYKVEFWSKTTTEMISTSRLVETMADAPWNSWNSVNTKSTHIGAWDVSVINTAKTGYIKGRVYANLLNMRIEGSSSASYGFYGKMYVLTKDGYTYRVDNNGNNGILFAFFVNNNGFVKGKQSNGSIDYTPLYKSLKTVDEAVNDSKIWDPTGPDNEQNITHKMFYTLPSEDLPKDTPVNGAVPGGSTWLRNTVVVPRVMNVRIQGADNTEGQVSTKGGYIKFNTESQGAYTIKIESNGTPSFATRYLYGTAVAGENSVYWDGKDGNLTSIPAGTAPASITVQLQGAEVHFPYFDMENNINGIKLELLDHELLLPSQEVVKSDIVYWNDTDISNSSYGNPSNPKNNSHLSSSLGGVGSSGISSNSNGHKWGGGNTTGTFGDVRSMDTWTFIKGEEETIDTNVAIKIADLKVESVTTFESGTNNPKDDFIVDDQLDYKVIIKNDGPSDAEEAPFTFRLPPGFEPDGDPVFSGNGCGTQAVVMEYDPVTHTYRSKLDLPNGCEIGYTFKATVTENSDPDDTDAVAGILRPNDVTDPNATNSSDPENDMYVLPPGRTWDDLWKYPADWPDANDVDNFYIPPFSAEFECTYSNNSVDPCNNIKEKPVGVKRVSDLAIQKTVKNRPAIINVDDEIEFELTVTNNGPHAGAGIEVIDIVPAGFTILESTISNGGTVVSGTNTIKWTFAPDHRLAKDDSFTLTFKVKVKSSGPYLNTATVEGDVEDPNPDNNTDTELASPQNNYWIGGKVGAPNDWDEEENWTGGYVPQPEEDIEFATELNNPTDPDNPKSGPAKDHLHLGDGDGASSRIIGDLINDSDKDLWITTGDQLTIKGEVKDDNPDAGTIVVKTTPTNPTGTLIFEDPTKNGSVGATVEFYNQAYDCADCGFYTRSWQYFGIPVDGSDFPFQSPVRELVNRWEEPVNGNKWISVTSGNLIPFRGYQITNTGTTEPDHIYDFAGTLYVGDKDVTLTRTTTPVVVNYAGANLVANSYTAAIPIKPTAMTFTNAAATVYLFNTGTRDEWRKLNGTAINQQGYRAGQYLAVPVNLGGTLHFPDRIPSMHSFMVLVDDAETTGNVAIKYDQLTKNTKVALGDGSTEIVTRSADSKSASSIPSLVMDVIGEESADRVWLFAKEGTTYGFDNGWDGRKMAESGIAQIYVSDDAGKDHFQVATVPGLNNVTLGFVADMDGKYTIEFALSEHWNNEEIYLHDLITGTKTRIVNGGSYTFQAKKGDAASRFSLSSSGDVPVDEEAARITVNSTGAGKITINNKSDNDCSVFISNTAGRLLQRLEVGAGNEQVVENISNGTYVVRLQNAVVNDARKVVVK